SLWDNGFTIQDRAGGDRSGIFVYTSSASPPLIDITPQVGDEVVLNGTAIEYFGLTELTYINGYDVISSGVTVEPVVVTTGALGLDCSESGEAYEGVLVEIRNATISNEPAIVDGEIDNQYVTYPIDDGSGVTELDESFRLFKTDEFLTDILGSPDHGDTVLKRVRGVVYYERDSYEIHPRSAGDISVEGFPRVFFSGYGQSSSNAFFEIYNAEYYDVSLDDLKWAVATDGSDGNPQALYDFPAGTTLAPGATFVVVAEGSSQDLLDKADFVLPSSVWSFDGNDAVAIVKGTSTTDYLVFDTVGDFGPAVSDGWDVCGVPAATKDRTLFRKDGTEVGTRDWDLSRSDDAFLCQWIVLGADDGFDFVGASLPKEVGVAIPTFSSRSAMEINANEGADPDNFGECYPSIYNEINGFEVTGVVNAAYTDGFCMQDAAGGSMSGLFVYLASGKTAEIRSVPVVEGDLVSVKGQVYEYFGLTELQYVYELTVLSSGNAVTAVDVQTGDIGTDCNDGGESYEGRLVCMYNVTVTSEVDGFGQYAIDDGSGPTQLQATNNLQEFFRPDQLLEALLGSSVHTGTRFSKLCGVVEYAFGSYEIYPRNSLDVVIDSTSSPGTAITIAELNADNGRGDGSDCYPTIYEDQAGIRVFGVITSLW
ncbi:MAG: lamin tail domain-containing protein, partial [Planctomycetota bacterium]